jgi:hypothetical protein
MTEHTKKRRGSMNLSLNGEIEFNLSKPSGYYMYHL